MKYRIKIQIRVQDATGSSSFVLFDRDVTGYFNKPASKFMSNANNVCNLFEHCTFYKYLTPFNI